MIDSKSPTERLNNFFEIEQEETDTQYYEREIKKTKSFWENMSKKELDMYTQKIFNYYRKVGYPYWKFTDSEIIDEYNRLLNADIDNIIQGNVITQTMHGLALAWSFHPHYLSVKCNNAKTPLDIFNDDKLFMTAIKKRLNMALIWQIVLYEKPFVFMVDRQ